MDIEEQLQIEYLNIVNELSQIEKYVEIEIKHVLKRLLLNAVGSNQILISSRVKDCHSAISKLKGEGGTFDDGESNSLSELNDLIGIRVSVFPLSLLRDAKTRLDRYLRTHFQVGFEKDFSKEGKYKIYKYRGFHNNFSKYICEIQLLPMLLSKFWDTEHDVFYKSVNDAPPMKETYHAVIKSLYDFEMAFEENKFKS